MSIIDQISTILSHATQPLTAQEILQRYKQQYGQGQRIDKHAVNQILYRHLQPAGSATYDRNSAPPRWVWNRKEKIHSLPALAHISTDDPQMVVLVDLGNVHDCLENLVPYANSGKIHVHAFADYHFNGYGIKPPAPSTIRVHKAATHDRNAADIDLIWTVAEYCFLRKGLPSYQRYQFIVATKDDGFQSLAQTVMRTNDSLVFVPDWARLREYIE